MRATRRSTHALSPPLINQRVPPPLLPASIASLWLLIYARSTVQAVISTLASLLSALKPGRGLQQEPKLVQEVARCLSWKNPTATPALQGRYRFQSLIHWFQQMRLTGFGLATFKVWNSPENKSTKEERHTALPPILTSPFSVGQAAAAVAHSAKSRDFKAKEQYNTCGSVTRGGQTPTLESNTFFEVGQRRGEL